MSEFRLHALFFVVAALGLAAGLLVPLAGADWLANPLFSAAALPVILLLAWSMLRDFLAGRMGVDAIALVAMAAGVALGEPLAATVVAIMYTGGNILEDLARGRAARALTALRDRTPRIAHRAESGNFVDISVEEVRPGDLLLVRAGELLPVDGALADPLAEIDESAVTGEPIAVQRAAGESLRSGTVNAGEAFRYHATAAAADSTYAGIVRMVEAARTAKAPFMRLADRFALLLLPVTLIIAGLAWFFSGDPVRALAVLVVATPCPLILAAPVAFIGGVSRAARAGVLMKGGAALEALSDVKTAVFDKTGTLTEGGARLAAIATRPNLGEDDALRLLASLEQASHHVLAAALVDLAHARGFTLTAPQTVKEYRGSGVEGVVEGQFVKAGSRALVMAENALPDWAHETVAKAEALSALSVFVAIDGDLAAVVLMADAIRADAPQAVAALRAIGLTRIIMVTGDDAVTARQVAATLKLDGVEAERDPAGKVEAIKAEEARQPTMMVGDGVNDAPALAAARVGVAMGARGATASSEAADVVILVDHVGRVAEAVAIARHARAIAMQSIMAGLALSGLAMVFAAFGYIPPVTGALLQEVIDVAVILNALRALKGPSLPEIRG